MGEAPEEVRFSLTEIKVLKSLLAVLGVLFLPSQTFPPEEPLFLPRGENIVINGGFEEGKNGVPIGWSFIKGISSLDSSVFHSGGFSLKYTRTDENDYRLVSQKLPCHPGKLYEVSLWIKGEDVRGKPADQGAGFCVEWLDKEGKWMGGNYPSCITGTFGWRQLKTYVRIPKEASSVHIILYMRRGTTGTAWFDDVQVTRVATPLVKLRPIFPSYRGILRLPSKGKKILVELEIEREDYDLTGVPLGIISELFNINGKVIAKSRDKFEKEEKDKIISLPLPDLRAGKYECVFRIFQGNEELAKEAIEIKAVKEVEEKVYIDERGRLIVDGKPFFPLGLYLGPTEDEHLKRIAEAGFNTLLCYGYGVGRDPESYMERAEKYGLKVIYSIKDFYEGTQYFPQMGKSGLQLAREYVEKFRDHPALLAWYINDELPISYIPILSKMYELVKELDPNHPQFQVLYQIPDLKLYYNCTDIMGVDPYPIPSQPITMVSDWTSSAVKAMFNAKPVWVVPQIFDWSVYDPERASREPTFEEKKNMFYQALINGANGLIAYSYFDLLRATGGKDAAQEVFKRRWQEVSTIAREVRKLIPVLLEGEDINQLQGKISDGQVLLRGLSFRNELYVLVANISEDSYAIDIPLPSKGWKSAKRIDGTTIVLKEGRLQDNLKPLEATTYVVTK